MSNGFAKLYRLKSLPNSDCEIQTANSDCQIASCVMFDAPLLSLDSATVLVSS